MFRVTAFRSLGKTVFFVIFLAVYEKKMKKKRHLSFFYFFFGGKLFELAWPVLASVGLRSVLAPLQSGHGIGPCRRICGGANDISFEPVSFLHSFPRRSHCTSFF